MLKIRVIPEKLLEKSSFIRDLVSNTNEIHDKAAKLLFRDDAAKKEVL